MQFDWEVLPVQRMFAWGMKDEMRSVQKLGQQSALATIPFSILYAQLSDHIK